jgi:hypothetical protein
MEALQAIDLESGEESVIEKSEIADRYYVHEQTNAEAIWEIEHELGKRPSVSVVDTGDNVIVPDILYIDDDNLELHFAGATSGKAYLN